MVRVFHVASKVDFRFVVSVFFFFLLLGKKFILCVQGNAKVVPAQSSFERYAIKFVLLFVSQNTVHLGLCQMSWVQTT